MKKITLTLVSLFYFGISFSQTVALSSGASITLDPGNSIDIGGTTINPSSNFSINGPVSISGSKTAIVDNNSTSINRVLHSNALLTGFSGEVVFRYLEEELNSISESNLVLKLQNNDGTWTTYTGIIDETNNTISYNFLEAISFKAITASAADINLTVENFSTERQNIRVYPNPTADRIFIESYTLKHIELYTINGQKVLESNAKELDVNALANGIYTLKTIDETNSIKTFKIIKK